MKAFASRRARRMMWIVWPGFLTAVVAEIAFFAVFDPLDFNARLALTRDAVYTFGFVAFWLLGMFSSALTLFLQPVAPPEDDLLG